MLLTGGQPRRPQRLHLRTLSHPIQSHRSRSWAPQTFSKAACANMCAGRSGALDRGAFGAVDGPAVAASAVGGGVPGAHAGRAPLRGRAAAAALYVSCLVQKTTLFCLSTLANAFLESSCGLHLLPASSQGLAATTGCCGHCCCGCPPPAGGSAAVVPTGRQPRFSSSAAQQPAPARMSALKPEH